MQRCIYTSHHTTKLAVIPQVSVHLQLSLHQGTVRENSQMKPNCFHHDPSNICFCVNSIGVCPLLQQHIHYHPLHHLLRRNKTDYSKSATLICPWINLSLLSWASHPSPHLLLISLITLAYSSPDALFLSQFIHINYLLCVYVFKCLSSASLPGLYLTIYLRMLVSMVNWGPSAMIPHFKSNLEGWENEQTKMLLIRMHSSKSCFFMFSYKSWVILSLFSAVLDI